MNDENKRIRAAILDWAGTMIDYGSLAPAKVFQKVFADAGTEISIAEAREPMGMAKREHIEAILGNPSVAERWIQCHGAPSKPADVDRLYEQFLPLQSKVIANHCDLIPGAVDTFRWCREAEIRVASTTGYTRAIMSEVTRIVAESGYQPEIVLCADDAKFGRPAPWLIFECAKQFNIYPMNHIVKVDDTVVGIEAGRHAGTWCVGIAESGNLMGCSEADLHQLDLAERATRKAAIQEKLTQAGAHFVIDTVAELPQVIEKINHQLQQGQPAVC